MDCSPCLSLSSCWIFIRRVREAALVTNCLASVSVCCFRFLIATCVVEPFSVRISDNNRLEFTEESFSHYWYKDLI